MKNILVLGASGYIGSQLLPLLLTEGFNVTAATRDIDYLRARVAPHPHLHIIYLDLIDAKKTKEIVSHYDQVFFLVHGMAEGKDFVKYELTLAKNFKRALEHSQVKQVIYLSALQPKKGSSKHLDARKATGKILKGSKVPIIELRAGMVIGAGSAAFEIMRDLVYNLPLLVTPKSVYAKANPIALDNLNYYLLELAKHQALNNQTYELGGRDILSYKAQFEIICKLSNKPFRLYATSLLSDKMVSRLLSLVTSVPSSIGQSLLEGLEHDFIANNEAITARFSRPLISFEQVVADTIKSEGEFIKTEVWGFSETALKRWQPSFGYYPKKAGASIKTRALAEHLWQVTEKIGSKEQGYYFANFLWRFREWLDVLVGGGIPQKNSPQHAKLQLGDKIDSWKLIRLEEQKFISLLFGLKAPGLGRLEITINDLGNERELSIYAWWHPKGFRGLLYWFAMMPAHLFIFRGMVKAMEKQARKNAKLPL